VEPLMTETDHARLSRDLSDWLALRSKLTRVSTPAEAIRHIEEAIRDIELALLRELAA